MKGQTEVESIDERTITDAILSRLEDASSPRVREVSEALGSPVPGATVDTWHSDTEGGGYLGSDAVFAVKESLVCELERYPAGTASEHYARLSYDFVLNDA